VQNRSEDNNRIDTIQSNEPTISDTVRSLGFAKIFQQIIINIFSAIILTIFLIAIIGGASRFEENIKNLFSGTINLSGLDISLAVLIFSALPMIMYFQKQNVKDKLELAKEHLEAADAKAEKKSIRPYFQNGNETY